MNYKVGDLVFIKHLQSYGLVLKVCPSKEDNFLDQDEQFAYLTLCQKDGKQYHYYEEEIERVAL